MVEPSLSIDEFNQPKNFKDKNAIGRLIARLILMEPGTLQNHPDMGVGIVSKYRHTDASKINDLKIDIQTQMSKYLPIFTAIDIEVKVDDNNILLIGIEIDGEVYLFKADNANADVEYLSAVK